MIASNSWPRNKLQGLRKNRVAMCHRRICLLRSISCGKRIVYCKNFVESDLPTCASVAVVIADTDTIITLNPDTIFIQDCFSIFNLFAKA